MRDVSGYIEDFANEHETKLSESECEIVNFIYEQSLNVLLR